MTEISLYLCAGQNVLLQLGGVHLSMLTAQLAQLCSWEFGSLWYSVLPFFPGNPMARAGAWVPACWRDSWLHKDYQGRV